MIIPRIAFLSNSRQDIYWDTCLFYEYFGGEKANAQRVSELNGVMREVEEGQFRIVTSLVTQLEVIPRRLDGKSAGSAQAFLDAFDDIRMIAVEVSPNVIALAREIRDYYYIDEVPPVMSGDKQPMVVKEGQAAKNMDLGDCIHLATAINFGINTFHTRDGASKSSRKRKTNIPLLDLAKMDSGKICGKYA